MAKEKILVVDDEPDIKNACVATLKMEDYEIDSAETGKEALELISKSNYNLLLLDIVLPDMTGIEILKNVRAKNVQCQAIIMTANPSFETIKEALHLGAYDYIKKPFNIAELVTRIKQCLLQQMLKEKDNVLIKKLKEQVASLEEMLEEKIMDLRIAQQKLQKLSGEKPKDSSDKDK